MIHLCCKVPNEIYVACSGGPDSMAAVDFFRRGRKQVTIAHLDHGTDHGTEAREFIEKYAKDQNIECIIAEIGGEKPKGSSWEEWWRDQRYKFFRKLGGTVVTAHHLDDVAEWWMYTACHGEPRLIPKQSGTVIRPFLSTTKRDLTKWCTQHDVPFVEDPTNIFGTNMRAVVRRKLMPAACEINLGLRKTMRKKILTLKDTEVYESSGGDGDIVTHEEDPPDET